MSWVILGTPERTFEPMAHAAHRCYLDDDDRQADHHTCNWRPDMQRTCSIRCDFPRRQSPCVYHHVSTKIHIDGFAALIVFMDGHQVLLVPSDSDHAGLFDTGI